jgi:RNA polymerase sigma factor (sigma-70 family)
VHKEGEHITGTPASRITVTTDEISSRSESTGSEVTSFEAIFLEQWPKIYTVLLRLVGGQSEAEDLAMEVFWRFHQNPPPLPWDNLGGWLYRIATRLGLNALRARVRRARYEEQSGRLDLIERSTTDPAEAAERSEELRQVREVLSKMKPRSARTLVLRYSGLNYREVAASLQVKPASVGKLLARAEEEFERIYRRMFNHKEHGVY